MFIKELVTVCWGGLSQAESVVGCLLLGKCPALAHLMRFETGKFLPCHKLIRRFFCVLHTKKSATPCFLNAFLALRREFFPVWHSSCAYALHHDDSLARHAWPFFWKIYREPLRLGALAQKETNPCKTKNTKLVPSP